MKIPNGLRRGDRVRIVHEATVSGVSDGQVHTDGFVLSEDRRLLVSVEKIVPPLPTKAGSIVRRPVGDRWVYRRLTRKGWWREMSGRLPAVHITDANLYRDRYETVFDASEVD